MKVYIASFTLMVVSFIARAQVYEDIFIQVDNEVYQSINSLRMDDAQTALNLDISSSDEILLDDGFSANHNTVGTMKISYDENISARIRESNPTVSKIDNLINYYPIPVNRFLTIEKKFEDHDTHRVSWKLVDLAGRELQSRSTMATESVKFLVDMTDLDGNIFLLNITVDSSTRLLKIIKK